jgi:hypothetical protein
MIEVEKPQYRDHQEYGVPADAPRFVCRNQERISVDRLDLIVPDLDQVPARVEEIEVLARPARAAPG